MITFLLYFFFSFHQWILNPFEGFAVMEERRMFEGDHNMYIEFYGEL